MTIKLLRPIYYLPGLSKSHIRDFPYGYGSWHPGTWTPKSPGNRCSSQPRNRKIGLISRDHSIQLPIIIRLMREKNHRTYHGRSYPKSDLERAAPPPFHEKLWMMLPWWWIKHQIHLTAPGTSSWAKLNWFSSLIFHKALWYNILN